ncbi:hypothetical protein [Catenulispora acidiphila]|uniref:hypothetical protein n=1 Tax=Catenulispora acidiphila TaxID=304895 RepID=UPI00019E403C|nr:hypothetical protein [Catenulispora acidiphila]
MDRPSFRSAQGRPYEFEQFKLAARGKGDSSVEAALDGDVVPLQNGFRPQRLHGPLPLYTDLMDFPPAHERGHQRRAPVHVQPHGVNGK